MVAKTIRMKCRELVALEEFGKIYTVIHEKLKNFVNPITFVVTASLSIMSLLLY